MHEGGHRAAAGGERDLSRLKAVGSTGSPLSPEGFEWVYDHVGKDTWLFSTSGGTDVVSAFVGGVPTLPVHLGELQARALGAKIEAWSPDGEPLIGEVGELVITEPMPSMPVFFWGDEDGARYRESYFELFPGVWRHGDWIEITTRGTAIIYGRSDSTINRGGIRMGTAEIYRAVLADDDVVDALVRCVPGLGRVRPLPRLRHVARPRQGQLGPHRAIHEPASPRAPGDRRSARVRNRMVVPTWRRQDFGRRRLGRAKGGAMVAKARDDNATHRPGSRTKKCCFARTSCRPASRRPSAAT